MKNLLLAIGDIVYIEWREMEKTLAEVFSGIGFDVELTPSSKDGGKDLVLECLIQGKTHSYFVEIKHWRAGSRVGAKDICDFVHVFDLSVLFAKSK